MCRTTLAAGAALLTLVPVVGLAQSVNMGSTFHALEARARQLTTTYPDGVVTVTRSATGAIEAVVKASGGPVGRLRLPAGSRQVAWHGGDAGAQEFALSDQTTVGLDWAAQQAYALHTDERAAAGEGRRASMAADDGAWDGHVRRDRQAMRRGASAGQLAARIQAVEAVFDTLVVRASLDQHVKRPAAKRIDYSRFTATLHDPRTGERRGFVRWFDTAQVLTWKIEGGSQGIIHPARLRGGWTFTPTMAWAAVQGYQFATQAARTLDEPPGPFALEGAAGRLRPVALLARAVAPAPAAAWELASSWTPPTRADSWARLGHWSLPAFGGAARVNEPGCDNLHWLDGSIFRACCDSHDKCYEAEGCSSGSWWWPFSGSWSCQKCNMAVVYCFCTVSNPAYCGAGSGGGSGGGDGGGGSCMSSGGGFCPVECQTCQSR